MTQVFFLPAENTDLPGAFKKLLENLGTDAKLKSTDLVAVKIHPGEAGNTSYVSAENVNNIINALNFPADRIFLTDTTVLYPGLRMSAPDYIRLAAEHGFGTPDTPPFIVADGLHGENEVLIEMPDEFDSSAAHLASIICSADAMIVISHFKGHLLTGFGGAIKNLGMGCASRAGKLYQHSSVKPIIKSDSCTACGICSANCPSNAITIKTFAKINENSCTGCGECLGRCPEGAIRVSWNQEMSTFMRRMVEYASVVARTANPVLYVNFITAVVPDCDCMHDTHPPLVDDIGILASTDPVALDKASLDLVTSAPSAANSPVAGKTDAGDDKFMAFRPDIDGELQLTIANSLGMGSMKYELISIH